jgi:hypothetical protein
MPLVIGFAADIKIICTEGCAKASTMQHDHVSGWMARLSRLLRDDAIMTHDLLFIPIPSQGLVHSSIYLLTGGGVGGKNNRVQSIARR